MIIDFHTHRYQTAEGVLVPRSFGIHPWQTSLLTEEDFPRLRQALTEGCRQSSIAMVGECGLDRLRGASLPFQKAVFELHLQVAEQLGKPVVVHCVRCMDELVELRKRQQWHMPWAVHGFHGSPQQAEQLWRLGIACSFGSVILRQQHSKTIEALQMLGKDRVFLETDDADCSIGDIYDAAAEWLHVGRPELEEAIISNYHRFVNQEQ